MTPEELAELKSLCEKATPGPWTVEEVSDESGETWVYQIVNHPIREEDANAHFISVARTAIPKLIEEIDRLKSAIAKVLADEESGKGWGPDVTTVRFLKSALKG